MNTAFCRELLPPARGFYEQELGELRRPSRGWASPKSGCPFHESRSKKSFTVNLESGGYYCFGCGAKGDLVAFMMQRYHLDFKTAAKQLGAWRENLLPAEHAQIQQRKAQQIREREVADQRKEDEGNRRLALRDEIHITADIQRRVSTRLSELMMAENFLDEQETCWELLSLALDDLRSSEAAYMYACGLESNE
jgi:hypothetical protein